MAKIHNYAYKHTLQITTEFAHTCSNCYMYILCSSRQATCTCIIVYIPVVHACTCTRTL